MGQTAGQIENYIDNKREHLSSNLQELESRVKSATDWRHQFRNRPLMLLGLAFGGGVLIASMSSGRSRRGYSKPGQSTGEGSDNSRPSPAKERAMDAWDNIKGAVVGMAATRFKQYADELLPGFSQHYKAAEAERKTPI